MKTIVTVIGLLVVVVLAVTITRVGILYSQVGRYKQYWEEERLRGSEANAIHYIALGDSGAQGIGATRPQKSYVGLLANGISDSVSRPVHVSNISVSGAKIADVTRKQIPEHMDMEITDDTIITLSIGGNDAVHKNSDFAADIDELFSLLPKQTIVADLGYFGGGRYKTRETYVQVVNPILHKTAEKYGLTVVPLHRVTKERDSLRNNAVDLFHPSDRGYHNWFDAFWPLVRKQL